MAVVDPSVQEVDEALAFGRETGWRVSVHAVSYSRVELIAFYEDLDPPANGTVAKCGWDPVLNRVVVELSRPDPEVESFFRSHIPDEALRFTYVGGRWHAAAL